MDVLDSAVASPLTKIGDVLKLVEVEVIFCGVTPLIEQVMTTAGVLFDKFRVSRDLKSVVKEVFTIQGIELVRKQQ